MIVLVCDGWCMLTLLHKKFQVCFSYVCHIQQTTVYSRHKINPQTEFTVVTMLLAKKLISNIDVDEKV